MAIYIIHEDLGFVFWLGHLLDGIGYEAIPAKSCPDAVDFLDETGLQPRLVVINPALPGVPHLLSRFRQTAPDLKVILVREENIEICEPFSADTECWSKPDRFDDIARMEWSDLVTYTLEARSAVLRPKLAS
jgi:hypothetical protein